MASYFSFFRRGKVKDKHLNENMKYSEGKNMSLLFEKGQMELLIFVDESVTNRHNKLQFDSKGFIQESNGNYVRREHIAKQRNDGTIQEMVFGNLPLALRGEISKFHVLKNPASLMVSKVFPDLGSFPRCQSVCSSLMEIARSREAPVELYGNGSIGGIASHHASLPVDMPLPKRSESPRSSGSGSGGGGSAGGYTLQPPARTRQDSVNSNQGSYQNNASESRSGSIQRRLIRNWSCDMLRRMKDCGDSLQVVPKRSKKVKIGMAILIHLDGFDDDHKRVFENLFFSHISIIEGYVNRLKDEVQMHFHNYKHGDLNTHVMKAFDQFRQSVMELYASPRLSDPLWLTLVDTADDEQVRVLTKKFIHCLASVVKEYDVPTTQYFFSVLLTCVLMHHLGWVETVSPSDLPSSRRTRTLCKLKPQWVEIMKSRYPYNPWWAQLGSLYGTLSYPLKLCKTVIIGKRADLVQQLLMILSYFIRCSEVQENCFDPPDFDHELMSSELVKNEDSTKEDSMREMLRSKQEMLAWFVANSGEKMSTTTETTGHDAAAVAKADSDLGSSLPNSDCEPSLSSSMNETSSGATITGTARPSDLMKACTSEERTKRLIEQLEKRPKGCSIDSALGGGGKNSESGEEERDCFHSPTDEPFCLLSNHETADDERTVCSDRVGRRQQCPLTPDSESCVPVSPSHIRLEQLHLSPSLQVNQSHSEEAYYEQVPLSTCSCSRHVDNHTFDLNCGWSLFGDYSDHYRSGFILQGVREMPNEALIRNDLLHQKQMLQVSPELDGQIAEAVCIVANLDERRVSVISSQSAHPLQVEAAASVKNLLQSVMLSLGHGIGAPFCLQQVENGLQEMYLTGRLVAEFLRVNPGRQDMIGPQLRVDPTDVPLLMCVAGAICFPQNVVSQQ